MWCAVRSSRHCLAIAVVQEIHAMRQANISNRINGEVVGPGTIVDHDILAIVGASLVELSNQPLDLVGDLKLPAFQIL